MSHFFTIWRHAPGRTLGLAGLLLGGVCAAAEPVASVSPSADHRAEADQALTQGGEHRAVALAHFLAAQLAEKAGHGREALHHYLEGLGADPANPEMAVAAANLAVKFRGRDEALKILQEQLRQHPDTPECYRNVVEFCLTYTAENARALDPALAAAEEEMKRFPARASSYTDAVRVHLAIGVMAAKPDDARAERDKAAQILDSAMEEQVTRPDFWLALGRSAEDVWPLADSDHRKERLPKINAFFEKALEYVGGAKDEAAELEIADYFLLSTQLDRALSICERVVRRSGSLEARRRVVRLLDAMDRPNDAVAVLEQLTVAYPADVESRQLLAQAYLQKDEPEKAVEQLEAIIKVGGGDVQDYVQICMILRIARSPEKFQQFTQRAVQLFPSEPHLMYYQGVALNELKDYAKAAEVLERTAKLAETRAPEQLNFDFYFQRGVALERSGRYEDASQQFEKSIELTPSDNLQTAAGAMNYLGYMWVERGEHLDRAEQLIKKAIELSKPELSAYVDSLGWLYFKRGRFQEALDTLRHAETLQKEWEPDDSEMLDHIAQTYLQLGQKDKAAEYWKRAIALNPDDTALRKRAEQALGLKTGPAPPKPEPNK